MCPFSGVTSCGRVWRKVPESDARSVGLPQTPNSGLRHTSSGAGERCSECGPSAAALSPRSVPVIKVTLKHILCRRDSCQWMLCVRFVLLSLLLLLLVVVVLTTYSCFSVVVVVCRCNEKACRHPFLVYRCPFFLVSLFSDDYSCQRQKAELSQDMALCCQDNKTRTT